MRRFGGAGYWIFMVIAGVILLIDADIFNFKYHLKSPGNLYIGWSFIVISLGGIVYAILASGNDK